MKSLMEKLERLLELGGVKKDVALLAVSGAAILLSLFGVRPFPFDMAWAAIILCGVPIVLEALIGLVTAFDVKADVLVSLALIASVAIGRGLRRRRGGVYNAAGRPAGGADGGQGQGRNREAGASDAPHRPGCFTTGRSPSSRPSRCAWATCCASCPARACLWTASSSPAVPPSTRRS